MALHTHLPIYKVAYDLLDIVTDLVKNMPRDFKQSIGGKISAALISSARPSSLGVARPGGAPSTTPCGSNGSKRE